MLGGLGAVGGWFAWDWFDREILSTLPPDLGRETDFRIPCSVQVYDSSGERVDAFYLERRVWVPIDQLPSHVWQAFVASEDRRFFEHRGVDPVGIARALAVNLRGGETRQGGSTITQQLVKNLLVGKERSYRRKLREAVLAYRLDDELDKMQLLELYVNFIALGSGNYGVEAAAQDYFGVSARELDVGQAAMLAGLVPAPSRYSPRHDPQLAAQRRENVLRLMVEQGFTTPAEASRHLADPVVVPRTSASKGLNAAYLTETRREIRRLFGGDRAYAEGLQVHTPLDSRVQRIAEEAVRDGLAELESRQGARAPVRRVPEEARPGFLARGDGLPLDPATRAVRAPMAGECFSAVADDGAGAVSAGPFRFSLHPDDLAARVRTGIGTPARPLAEVLARGDVLDVCVPSETTPSDPPVVRRRVRPWAESAAVVLENATGNVVALVGGYDVGLEGFVRATQALRQPGSSFKPFVYATALRAGMRQVDTVVDAPFSIPGTNGLPWSPRNYDGEYHGVIPLRRALALSLNTVAVRLAHTHGVDAIVRLATDLGVRTPLRSDLTVALGSSEVTPMDLASAYASLARMGVRIDPAWITRVEDRNGRVLARAGERIAFTRSPFPWGGGALPPRNAPPGDGTTRVAGMLPGGAGTRVLDAGTAYVMVDMMRNVFYTGTAKKGQREGMDFAGKTGTTSGFVDAWFVGFSPRYTVAVWVGTDGTASLGDKETGGKAALPTWSRIMEALPNVPGERFPVPDDAVLVPAGPDVRGTRWLGFVRGTVPQDVLPAPALRAGAPLPPFGGSWPVAHATAAEPDSASLAQSLAETLPEASEDALADDVEEGALDPATGWPAQTPLPDTWVAPQAGRDPFAAPADEGTPAAKKAATSRKKPRKAKRTRRRRGP
ncbi:MAG: hypothetical protein RLZZ299_2557 [Pseudomonadota bacterium]